MPRINIPVGANAEQAISKLLLELDTARVVEADPTQRHVFPGRARFLRKGFLRRQMWRQHTTAIMKNFEVMKENREEIRRRLRNQKAASENF